MSTLISESEVEVRVRAETYAFLARSVQYPQDPIVRGLLEHIGFDDELLEASRVGIVASSTADIPSLQAAHRVLFPAVESQDAPSYATAYSKQDVFRQGQVMADAAGFYRAHGLTLGGVKKDRPDGIGPELEFMGFLAAKQAHAGLSGKPDMVELCLETQVSFLSDHLGAWGPDYGRRMASVSDHPFYQAVGSFLAAWLEMDMERFDVTPLDVDHLPVQEFKKTSEDVLLADPHLRWDDLSCGGGV